MRQLKAIVAIYGGLILIKVCCNVAVL